MQVVADRFEILSLAGHGGMARVYLALDHETGERVALKLLIDDSHAAHIAREGAALACLDHPGIVRHVDHREGGTWLAMQWLDGETLRVRLGRAPLAVPDVLDVAVQIASALAHVHARGLVHRDVKPSNVLLPGGACERATLIDFGLVRQPGRDSSEAGLLVGTPGYMAPEQILGEDVGPLADVFALGSLIFRCFGASPFVGKGATAVLTQTLYENAPRLCARYASAPPVVGDLVDRMLLKTPSDRPGLDEVLGVLSRARTLSKIPTPAKIEKLSARELRIVSVIVAGGSDAGDTDATLRRAPAPDIDLDHMRAVASKFDAKLNLLPNGALVAFITAQGTATDLAVRAAQLALALELRLRDMPIVLATGRAELGETVVGEAIDRATEMLRSAPPSAVTIDHVTAGLLDARFEVAGRVLVRERSTVDAPRTLLGRKTTSVGRANDLSRLVDMFEESIETSSARAGLVIGPAGIGKSRLRHELTSEVQAQANVWIGSTDAMHAASPYGLLAPMLRGQMGIAESDPQAARWEKVLTAVESHDRLPRDNARRVATFLGDMLGCPPMEPSPALIAARRDPRLYADQVTRALCDYFALWLARRPLVVVLEELHWADAPSITLMTEALRMLARSQLFVVGIARPEVTERFPNLWAAQGVRKVVLSGLPPWAATKLVRQLLGDVPDHVAGALVERAEGNPFYLEELIRAHAEGRSEQTPETILAMAQARLERIDPALRRVLRAASVVGASFWDGAVLRLLGGELTGDALASAMKELEARELVLARSSSRFAAEKEHAFRHALVHEAAYSLLTDADRAHGHRIVAEWMRDSGETDPMVVAEHFDRGGDSQEAAPLYMLAARASLDANDPGGALERVRAAERCGVAERDLGKLRSLQAVAYRHHNDVALAVSTALVALDLLPVDSVEWVEALEVVGTVGAGSPEAIDRLILELRGMFERGITPRTGIVPALSIEALNRAGRNDMSKEILERLSARQDLLADPVCRAEVYYARSSMAFATNPAAARDWLMGCIAAHDEVGNMRAAAAARMNLASAYALMGQFAVAEELLRRARTNGAAFPAIHMIVDHNLGLVLARLGKLDEALEKEQRALEAAEASGARMVEGFCRVYLAKIHRARGDARSAEADARQAAVLLAAVPPGLGGAYAELAAALLEMGRPSEALEASTRGMEIRASIGPLEESDIVLQVAHAEALAASGDTKGARERLELACADIDRVAATIQEDASRATFLRDVPENARASALASRM